MSSKDKQEIQAINNFPIVLSIRMTPALHAQISENAEMASISMSRYARRVLEGHRIIPTVDNKIRAELRNLGRNLVWAVRSGTATAETVDPIIEKIDAAIERI